MSLIPDDILAFLGRAEIACGGTRDKNLMPHLCRVSGWRVNPDRRSIRCFVPEAFTNDLIGSLEDNGQFALTIVMMESNETYQIKGQYRSAGPCDEDDVAAFKQCRKRFVENSIPLYGFTEEMARAYIIEPTLTVDFSVREIFVQTPRPGAGRRVVPAE